MYRRKNTLWSLFSECICFKNVKIHSITLCLPLFKGRCDILAWRNTGKSASLTLMYNDFIFIVSFGTDSSVKQGSWTWISAIHSSVVLQIMIMRADLIAVRLVCHPQMSHLRLTCCPQSCCDMYLFHAIKAVGIWVSISTLLVLQCDLADSV